MISVETISFNRSNFNDSLNHKIETGVYQPGFHIRGDEPRVRINVYFDCSSEQVVVDGRLRGFEDNRLYRFCYTILNSSNMTISDYLEYMGIINTYSNLEFTVDGTDRDALYTTKIRDAAYPTINLL